MSASFDAFYQAILHRMADWLSEHHIQDGGHVESTGVLLAPRRSRFWSNEDWK